jgi:hypothetical protein
VLTAPGCFVGVAIQQRCSRDHQGGLQAADGTMRLYLTPAIRDSGCIGRAINAFLGGTLHQHPATSSSGSTIHYSSGLKFCITHCFLHSEALVGAIGFVATQLEMHRSMASPGVGDVRAIAAAEHNLACSGDVVMLLQCSTFRMVSLLRCIAFSVCGKDLEHVSG